MPAVKMDRMDRLLEQVTQLVAAAAAEAEPAPDAQPWDYGWSAEAYRRSAGAALSSPGGPVCLSREGVEKLEEVYELLIKQQRVRDRWDREELWSIVGSLIAFISTIDATEANIAAKVRLIMDSKPSLVVFPVSNLNWEGEPLRVGKRAVIGLLGDEFGVAVSQLGGRAASGNVNVADYIRALDYRSPAVGFAVLVPGQSSLARAQASRTLELLIDLSILLVTDKQERQLWSLRGSTNRPGVRGISLDRAALAESLRTSGDAHELYSKPLVLSAIGPFSVVEWLGEDPIPLKEILQDPVLREAIERSLSGDTAIRRRVQVAARWFADSYWAAATDDATLAAGVALDSLIGSTGGLPGRAMKERYALLESDPTKRAGRAKDYQENYNARSKIAHGGEAKEIDESGFLRSMQDSITWATWRLLEAESVFSLSTDKEFDALVEDLRWGIREWPMSQNASNAMSSDVDS
ncbi:hypothetical protein ACWGR4_15655 [Embleya sp. NPDC055664]